MAKLIYAEEAKAELLAAARYYENCKPGLGQAFLLEAATAIDVIVARPHRWRKIKGKFRRYLLRQFPYGIIYAVDGEEVFVAAVMHQKRKPEYWQDR